MTTAEFGDLRSIIRKAAAALLVALVVQSFALTWWAASITTRVGVIERQLELYGQRIHRIKTEEK